MSVAPAVQLDVRPVLARGEEPFELIMSTAAQVSPGGVLALTAPFEPVPLYPVMRKRGFSSSSEFRGPGEWVVTFRHTGVSPDSTLSEIAARVPETAAVFARHGLDLCCGGSKTLAVAAKAHRLDLDALLAELQAVAR